jgi:hypothetical protein
MRQLNEEQKKALERLDQSADIAILSLLIILLGVLVVAFIKSITH